MKKAAVDAYEAVLADLKATRDRIDKAIAGIEAIRSSHGNLNVEMSERQTGHREAPERWQKMTVKERLAVLRYAHDRMTQDQFAAAIGEAPGSTRYKEAERTGNLGRRLAEVIYRRFPELDAGWLYQGLTGNLTQAMEKRLSEAASELGLGPRRGE
jgi:hypothetical protein